MITRRKLLILLGFLGFTKVSPAQSKQQKNLSLDKTKIDLPPHFEAISLVWQNQKEQIKTVELQHAHKKQSRTKEYINAEGRWWFDTDKRRWDVFRPFEPGGVDSTHMFIVRYFIDDKMFLYWNVNTEDKTVSLLKSEIERIA
jgi:hypothetical protein